MGNTKFTVRYDGRDFWGWQRLKDKPTVQGTLEQALAAVEGQPVVVVGAGRTDRGAHAEGQVFGASVSRDPPGLAALVTEINQHLPATVRVLEAQGVPEDFHARTDATSKVYRYEIYAGPDCPAELVGLVWHTTSPLALAPMKEACELFLGEMDFASFATKPNFKQKSTVKRMDRIELHQEGPRIRFVLEANGFLYKMVRNIVRAVAKVGEGRTDLDALRRIIDAKDRKAAPGTAPASGLFLDAVRYG